MAANDPVSIGQIEGDRIHAVIVPAREAPDKHHCATLTSAEELREITETSDKVDVEHKAIIGQDSHDGFALGSDDVQHVIDNFITEHGALDPAVEVETDRTPRPKLGSQFLELPRRRHLEPVRRAAATSDPFQHHGRPCRQQLGDTTRHMIIEPCRQRGRRHHFGRR